MPDKIFFSYSRSDSAFVLKLASDLRDAGANIWLDQLDITPGKHWDSEIEEALNNSNCLLAILSPKSMESNNAMDEISFALEENKKVIPVLLTNTETPFRLRRLQRVDFTGDYDKGFRQLLTSLNLKKEPIANTPPIIPDKTGADNEVLNGPSIKQKEAQQKELDMWEKACSVNTLQAYEDYLDKTTLKYHSDEARNYLYKLSATTGYQKAAVQLTQRTTLLSGSRKMYLFVAIGLIGLAVVTWAAFKILNKETPIQLVDKNDKNVSHNIVEKKDSANEAVKIAPATNKTSGPPAPPPEDTTLTQPENNISQKKETVIRQNKIPVKKAVPAKTYIPEKITVAQNKETEKLSVPSDEKKEFQIYSRVTVTVKLSEIPDMNQKKKSEQTVKFLVTRAVEYNGVVIIRQGATARGTLTIGSKLADITINMVEGANGKNILLRSENDRIKRHEIESGNTFNAIIQPGTRFSY